MDFADEGDLASKIKEYTQKKTLMPEDLIWE